MIWNVSKYLCGGDTVVDTYVQLSTSGSLSAGTRHEITIYIGFLRWRTTHWTSLWCTVIRRSMEIGEAFINRYHSDRHVTQPSGCSADFTKFTPTFSKRHEVLCKYLRIYRLDLTLSELPNPSQHRHLVERHSTANLLSPHSYPVMMTTMTGMNWLNTSLDWLLCTENQRESKSVAANKFFSIQKDLDQANDTIEEGKETMRTKCSLVRHVSHEVCCKSVYHCNLSLQQEESPRLMKWHSLPDMSRVCYSLRSLHQSLRVPHFASLMSFIVPAICYHPTTCRVNPLLSLTITHCLWLILASNPRKHTDKNTSKHCDNRVRNPRRWNWIFDGLWHTDT